MIRYIIVIALISLAGCVSDKGNTAAPTPPCSNTPGSLKTIQTMNNVFMPDTVNAVVGDTLKWIWVEGFHTTTSKSIPTGAAPWNSDLNSGVPEFKYIIQKAGTYNYDCTIHGAPMTGTIIVSPPC